MPLPVSQVDNAFRNAEPTSALYVQMFSWVGMLIGAIHVIEGRSIGLAQCAISAIGVYASWNYRAFRVKSIAVYAFGCVIWALFDAAYMMLLIVAKSEALRNAITSVFASNTFPDLGKPLSNLLVTLGQDASVFTILIALSSAAFTFFAAYWALTFRKEVAELMAATDVLAPLLAPSLPFQRQPRERGPTRGPFSGRGYRLGT